MSASQMVTQKVWRLMYGPGETLPHPENGTCVHDGCTEEPAPSMRTRTTGAVHSLLDDCDQHGCFPLGGHTRPDAAALVAANVDPESTQPRERAVPCSTCARPTFNQAGGCDNHYLHPAAVTRGAA